jgi:membrane protein DedA with SNARE-associated domain
MDGLIQTMEEWVTSYGYVAIFLLMLADIVFPSEVTLMVGGWYAADGRLDFWLVVVAAVLGNLVFGWILYALGRKMGRDLLFRYGRYVMIKPQDVDKAEIWWDKHGEAATFFSRLIPVVRTLISLPAGIARMPLAKFTLYTVLGMTIWAALIAWLGLAVEDNWETVVSYFDWPTLVIVVLLVGGGGVWYWRRRKQRKALDHAAEQAETSSSTD